MYKRINNDVGSDLELIFKYLSNVSEKVDWFDDDMFDLVLTMRDDALKASQRVDITEDD